MPARGDPCTGADTPPDQRMGFTSVTATTPTVPSPPRRLDLLTRMARRPNIILFGVDSLRDDDGEWRVRQYTGDPSRTRAFGPDATGRGTTSPGASAPDASRGSPHRSPIPPEPAPAPGPRASQACLASSAALA